MFFQYRKQKIYYEVFGTSKDILLILPGWGNVFPTYSYIISVLKEYYTIYYIHYPGFGKSPALDTTFTIYDYVDMIFSFLKKKKISNPVIMAHSFGGRIASILIGKYNLVCYKLILMDVAGIKHFSLKLFFKRILYKTLKSSSIFLPCFLRSKFQKKLIHIFSSSDYNQLPISMRYTFQNIIKEDLKKYYSSITCDTLIIWGKKDLDTPLKDAYYLQKHISNSGLIVYPDCGHFSYYEDPYKSITILLSYLKK